MGEVGGGVSEGVASSTDGLLRRGGSGCVFFLFLVAFSLGMVGWCPFGRRRLAVVSEPRGNKPSNGTNDLRNSP